FRDEGITFERVGPTAGPGPEAQRLEFVFPEQGRVYREQSVFARLDDGSCLSVTYVTPAQDTAAPAQLDRILQSTRARERGAAAAGRPVPPAVRVEQKARSEQRAAALVEVGTYGGVKMYERRRPGAAGPVEDYVCEGTIVLPNGAHVYLSGQCAAVAADRMKQ